MENAEPDLKWRVIRSRPKCEHLAAQHLVREGFESFCPRVRHRKKTTRGPVWFVEALFPGYLFCRFDVNTSLRHVVSTPFVTQALNFMHDAGSVPDTVISGLKNELDEKDVVTVETTFQTGDTVEIVDGPLRGSPATITRLLPGRDRVRVLLEFIGGQQEIEVPLMVLLGCRDARTEAMPK